MKEYSIAIFPIKSETSIELINEIIILLMRKYSLPVNEYKNHSVDYAFEKEIEQLSKVGLLLKIYNRFVQEIEQMVFFEACLSDDIVIIDATREGENNEINNFDIANEHPKSLEHILVVSRNYLPINFYGTDNGGYPDYKTNIFTNLQIIDWLEKKLVLNSENKQQNQIILEPRKTNKPDIKKFLNGDKDTINGFYKYMDESIDHVYNNKNQETSIFISFKTKYQYQESIRLVKKSFEYLKSFVPEHLLNKLREISNNSFDADSNDFQKTIQWILGNDYNKYKSYIMDCTEHIHLPANYKKSVKQLSLDLKDGIYHNNESKTAKYLEDGSLVYATELNTKQRIWQLLTIIDHDYIMHCDELWIYGSDDYLDSWWTRGELLVYSYLLHQNIDKRKNKKPRKLMLYNPVTDRVKEIKPLAISDKIAKRIARIQSNCSPGGMGYESVKSLRLMNRILWGIETDSALAIEEYIKTIFKKMLPYMLLQQGLNEEQVNEVLKDQDALMQIETNIKEHFSELKLQVKKGKLSKENKEYYQSMFRQQMNYMPESTSNLINENELIDFLFGKDYLVDEVFSNEFWETVLLQKPINKSEKNIEEKLNDLENEIEELLDFSKPEHENLGTIKDIETKMRVGEYNVIQKASRFIFMPSRLGGLINLSETGNNLQELPIYIIEN